MQNAFKKQNSINSSQAALAVLLLTTAGCLLPAAPTLAQTPSAALFDLADFGSPGDAASSFPVGTSPAGLVAGPNGTFYGFTQSGGASGDGTVFKVLPYGTGVTPLYAFGSGDGMPSSLTLSTGGTLYGTSANGGPNLNGLLFTLADDGTKYQALYAFSATNSSSENPDGASPVGSLLEGKGGALCGETQYGGSNADGVVYTLHPDGSGFTVLHAFGTNQSNGSSTDGTIPVGGLTRGPGGTLYGVTGYGGAANTGTVFMLNPDGTGYAVLHEFSAEDGFSVNSGGAIPSAALTLGADGLLYGVSGYGGSGGSGVVFRLHPDGSGFTVLHEFHGSDDGASPVTALVPDKAGNLYGTTSTGGGGQGTVFRLEADGAGHVSSAFVSLYSLQAGDGTGAALVEGSSGLVYGTSTDGGTYSAGDLFRVDLTHLSVHILWNNTAGAISVWNYSPTGGMFTQNTYGQYLGWKAKSLADGPDGLSRILWMKSDGTMSLWSLDNETAQFNHFEFGPFPGWTARAVSVGADNTTHILWNSTSGETSLWNYNVDTGSLTQNTYDSYPGWTAKSLADGPDGLSRILWMKTDGMMSLWSLDNEAAQFTHFEFGPYPGWTANAVSVGADNATHVVWAHTSGAASVWNYSTADGSFTEKTYGPYPGWTASAVTNGPDNVCRVLWTSTAGQISAWNLDSVTGAYTDFGYGPYPDWKVLAISAGL